MESQYAPNTTHDIYRLIKRIIKANINKHKEILAETGTIYYNFKESALELKELDEELTKSKKSDIDITDNDFYIKLINFLSEECKNVLPIFCSNAATIINNVNLLDEYSAFINILKDTISTHTCEIHGTVSITYFDSDKLADIGMISKLKNCLETREQTSKSWINSEIIR